MIGLIVWAIIFIVIAACLLPWWFLPAMFVYFFLVEIGKKH